MKLPNTSRLHALRMANDAKGYDLDEMRPRFAALATRHEDGTAPRAVSAFQLFQTPATLADRLCAALNIRPGERILEPSAGLGRLLDSLHCYAPGEVVAVEIAPQCAGELFTQDRRAVKIFQRDFLTTTRADLGEFDAVAMNPPFHMRADIRHIMHARSFLRPGGRLAALCLDTPHREEKLRPLCESWERIPAGTFAGEGTRVPTILLTLKV